MFNKPNQLIFYVNVLIVIFGVLVALITPFAVVGLIIAISAALLIFDQIRQNKSAFSIDDLKKTLTVHDSGGNKATLTQIQMTTSCHADNSEYWFRNIRAVGSISNFRINDHSPDEQKKEGDNYQLCMRISPELKLIDGAGLTLTYEYQDAFTQNEGMLSHIVDDDTRQLRMTIQLPEGRTVSTARFFCQYDDREEALLPPTVTGKTIIEAVVENPKIGAEYCLQWRWADDGVLKKLGRLF
ncbi:MAG: hypothetical protein LZF61_11010 [Nitrosomonas sp.]|nr:MAG: hypothetical protein LZF61_11010 [Nitrosomonas sp.]